MAACAFAAAAAAAATGSIDHSRLKFDVTQAAAGNTFCKQMLSQQLTSYASLLRSCCTAGSSHVLPMSRFTE
jgi:hypothetical protein